MLALSCWLYHSSGLQEKYEWQWSLSTCTSQKDIATLPFFFVLTMPPGSWDLSYLTRDGTRASAVKSQSPNQRIPQR